MKLLWVVSVNSELHMMQISNEKDKTYLQALFQNREILILQTGNRDADNRDGTMATYIDSAMLEIIPKTDMTTKGVCFFFFVCFFKQSNILYFALILHQISELRVFWYWKIKQAADLSVLMHFFFSIMFFISTVQNNIQTG